MPAILMKDYEWRQSTTSIIINLPLVGNPSKVDFLTSNNYVKASYPPYIFELFLWETINEEESECIFNNKEAIISLKKCKLDLQWPTLELEDIDKESKQKCRTEALEYSQLAAEQKAKSKSEKQQKLQKQAVRAQIDLDTSVLNKIETIRDTHRKEAMKELEEWRLSGEEPIFEGVEGKVQQNRKAYREPLKWFQKSSNPESQSEEVIKINDLQKLEKQSGKEEEIEESSSKKINKTEKTESGPKTDRENGKETSTTARLKSDKDDETSNSEDSESDFEDDYFNNSQSGCLIKEMDEKDLKKFYKKKEKELKKEQNLKHREKVIQRFIDRKFVKTNHIFDDPKKSIPLPRKCSTINVSFSERAFPTPARESYQLQEQEWLEKQAEARRKTGFVSEDLRPEEQNPQWLKDKGDDFFKDGNYLGAISAYTHGIKFSDKMASLYVNRSAAHYALENYCRCVEDCSTALELMVPKCEGNRESRARCHARRGAALCKLSSPQHGIPELEAALKLAPDNESIKLDLVTAKKYFQLDN